MVYTRKRDFFGYQELHEIKVFNIPALISYKGQHFIESLINAMKVSFEFLQANKDQAAEKYVGEAGQFIDDCGDSLKDNEAIKQVAEFIDEDASIVSRAMVYKLLELPVTSPIYAVSAVMLDTLWFIADVVCIAGFIYSIGGATGLALAKESAKIAAKKRWSGISGTWW